MKYLTLLLSVIVISCAKSGGTSSSAVAKDPALVNATQTYTFIGTCGGSSPDLAYACNNCLGTPPSTMVFSQGGSLVDMDGTTYQTTDNGYGNITANGITFSIKPNWTNPTNGAVVSLVLMYGCYFEYVTPAN